jgi:regulator of nucleoside diphosphate kinase
MKRRTLLITEDNCRRLEWLIDRARSENSLDSRVLPTLRGELEKARIVPSDKVPEDLVTMNSVVRIRDLDTDEIEVYEVVYPAEADIERNRVSVLAPIGMALLGYRAGDVIECPVPAGVCRLRVEEVVFQPETAGAFAE